MTKQQTQAKQTKPKTTTPKRKEVTYSVDEIISQHSAIGVKPEVLAGALLHLDKKELTKTEIEKALREFKTKEVK